MIVKPGSRLYRIWKSMKRRCQSPADPAFANYGGRGIVVCAEWQTFVGFLDWALTAGYANDRQIDRIDNDADYEPENCRWITAQLNLSRQGMDADRTSPDRLTGSLSDEQVATAQPAERPYKLQDGDGLYLRIATSGVKSWRYRYRFSGKERLLTIGRYPAISLAEAREHRIIAKSRLDRGRSPAAIKQNSKARQLRRTKHEDIARV